MSHAALTARYRPQTFAEVAGQETIKTILSRASQQGKVAPAYLFSGTRGVGKTTLARIFAKALNCRKAPASEPCNQCDQCRAITAGNAVDVVEIDGASNRGIDDVRRLKEVVGYAPMEGGYKIFIIDEAHMLSREAFNALLKTLEEPPARVTFIMATTEPHKFPATIISRCQHYVFKRLPESGLLEHLSGVLDKEGVPYEENALRLIARRGAGSVRDSMSLLGQVLALGEASLTEESVRNVLGLAGQEAFPRLLECVKSGDSPGLSLLLREMLDQGLDMGFFLRELAGLWRNLFMLRQSGEAALPVVELPEKEARACLETARDFSLQHIHACWQMTLDGQRRVLTSLEPALALELLLLNIAMLPRLLPMEGAAGQGKLPPQNAGGSSGRSGQAPSGGRQNASGSKPTANGSSAAPETAAQTAPGSSFLHSMPEPGHQDSSGMGARVSHPEPGPTAAPDGKSLILGMEVTAVQDGADEQEIQEALDQMPPAFMEEAPTMVLQTETAPSEGHSEKKTGGQAESMKTANNGGASTVTAKSMPIAVSALEEDETASSQETDGTRSHTGPLRASPPDWGTVLTLAQDKDTPPRLLQLLRRAAARQEDDGLVLVAQDIFSAEQLRKAEVGALVEALFVELCGFAPRIQVRDPERKRKSRDELKQEILEHPLVREVETLLGARTIDFGQLH